MQLKNAVRRPELEDIAQEFEVDQSRAEFIANKVMPPFEIGEQAGKYPFIPMENWMKARETRRAPRSGSDRGDWKFEMRDFSTEERQTEEAIDDTERKLYRSYFKGDVIATGRAIDTLLREHEKLVADIVMKSSNAGINHTLAKPWTDPASDPRKEFRELIKQMKYTRLITPNVVVMHDDVIEALINHPKFIAHVEKTRAILLDGFENQVRAVQSYLRIPQILVPGGMYDDAPTDKQAELKDIWGSEKVAILKVSTDADIFKPMFGRNFIWDQCSGTAGNSHIIIDQYRDEPVKSTVIRACRYVKPNVMATQCNTLISNVLA